MPRTSGADMKNVLLDYEFRLRSGAMHAGRKADLKAKVIEVLKHVPAVSGGTGSAEDAIIARLNQARGRFQQRQPDFDAWAKAEPSLCRALQARNRGIRLAACGMRWHQAILGCNVNGELQYTARLEQLRKLLASLLKLSLEVNKLADSSAKADVDAAAKPHLDKLASEVQGHAEDLYGSWQSEAKELATTSVPVNGGAARIEAILAIPVLSAKERIALLKLRRTLEVPLVVPEKLPSRESPQTAFAPSLQFIARIAAQAELEQKMALLSVPKADLDWRQFKDAKPEELRRVCEDFGARLVKLQAVRARNWAGSGQKVFWKPDTAIVKPWLRSIKSLRWADARDIKTLDFIPPWMLGPPPVPKVIVQLLPKEAPKANSSESTPSYKLSVRVAEADAKEAEFSWDCDSPQLAAALQVRSSSGQEHLLSRGVMYKIDLLDNFGRS